MALNNISLAQYIVGKLRQNLTDYNSSNRTSSYGNWIFPDKPMITKLLNNKNNFPRISVEEMPRNTISEMGMRCSDHEENQSLKINIWSVRDLICDITSTTDEAHAYVSGTNEYDLTNLPFSDISIVSGTKDGESYTFIKGTDYQSYDSDSDGFKDQIKWLGDVPDNGTSFYVNYARKGIGAELVRIIAQDIHTYLRDNWRNWSERSFWNYRLISANPIDFDENISVYRYEIQIQFAGINIGEIV